MTVVILTVLKVLGVLVAGLIVHYSADLLLSAYWKDMFKRGVVAFVLGCAAMIGIWPILGVASL